VQATRNVLQAAAARGIKRYLHMSANGAREEGETGYHRTKWEAEELVRASGLDWTIFRPSLIFGPGGEFVEMLGDLVRQLPIVPVIGDGRYRMQPVAVSQVAETYLKALALPEAIGQSYELGGGESYSYDQILDLVGEALGKAPVLKAHQPLVLVKPMVKLLEHFEKFPLTSDQLTMLLEGNECDQHPWAKAFGIEPQSFAAGIGACYRPRD
jgi:NADH dehydrogenase